MEKKSKEEKKGKKVIIIAIIVILLLIILTLAIVFPLVLRKKDDKTKEATITLTATKGSGEGSFEGQKWFSKVGDETLEHTTEDPMTITAKSGETVYFGYSYALEYERDGGAYLETLTNSSTKVDVTYAFCPAGTTDDTAYFDEALTNAIWKTWEEDETTTTDNHILLKIVIHKLHEDENVAVNLGFAVVDGEYRSISLTIPPVTGNHDPRIKNFFTQINGESNMYDYNDDEPINLQIKEGETIYVGLWDVKETYGIESFESCLLRSLSVSEGLTVTCYTYVNHYNAPTVEEFDSIIKDISSLEIVNPGEGYSGNDLYPLFILKIVANSSITAEELSINISFEYYGVVEG